MTHKFRGKVLVFNHSKYEARKGKNHAPSERKGTLIDYDSIYKTFSKLDFEVNHYKDKKYLDIIAELEKASKNDYSDHDCLVVIVMTHGGDNGVLFAYDEDYTINDLLDVFMRNNCPSLKDKPKLFFIQACRGFETDYGYEINIAKRYNETTEIINELKIQNDVNFINNNIIIPTREVSNIKNETKIPVMADFLIMYSSYQGS